jgi:type VI secretion system secreted protein VgrG
VQRPPYKLPGHKTVSGLKSDSTKGGNGFNEIRFEDKKGEEQIFIHGEKNLDIRIKNDAFETIGNNRHIVVKKDEFDHVENNRHEIVDADHIEQIGKDRHLNVTGKEAKQVGGSLSLTVKGDVIEVFNGDHSERTSQNLYLKGFGVVIESMTGLTLKCGGNSVVIDSAGVTIKGGVLVLDGDMVNINSGPGSSPASGQAGSAVTPTDPKAAEEADQADPGEVEELKMQQIQEQSGKYGSAEVKPYKPDPEKKSWIEIKLVDEEGDPVPGEPYSITLPDGQTVAAGTLDEKGFARIEGIDPGTCQITFPQRDTEAWKNA